MIWKNAHPDYDITAQGFDKSEEKEAASLFWNWGRAPASELGENEVWEDELGSSKADLFDNCSNQERYLKVKIRAPAMENNI